MITYWLILNIADTVITLCALAQGHEEVNQIMCTMSGAEFVVYKVVMTLVVLVLLRRIGMQHLLKLLNVSMGFVVLWNLIWVITF